VAIDCSFQSSLSESTPTLMPVPSVLKYLRARSAACAARPSEVIEPGLAPGVTPGAGGGRWRTCARARCIAATRCVREVRGFFKALRGESMREVWASRAGLTDCTAGSAASSSRRSRFIHTRVLVRPAAVLVTVPPSASSRATASGLMSPRTSRRYRPASSLAEVLMSPV